MAPRRRALRDHGDAGPLVALARAAVKEAHDTIQNVREGLEHHYLVSAECRIIDANNQRRDETSDYD